MGDITYKQSFYNVTQEHGGRMALYNVKNGGVVVPAAEVIDKVKLLLGNPDVDADNDDELRELKASMIEYKFIVDTCESELDELKSKFDFAVKEEKNDLGFVILPTEACNFACPYCFVLKYDRGAMKQHVWDGIYNMIVAKIRRNKEREQEYVNQARTENRPEEEIAKIKIPTGIHITWFGGEPTLMAEKIIGFMDKLIKMEKENENVSINAGMITNGYLLNYNLFREFTSRKIDFFQITLDGDKETHDTTRYLRGNCGPTFDVIYANLLDIQRNADKDLKFRISIRSNFLKNTVKSMEKLKSRFTADFHDERFTHYFNQVHPSEKDTAEVDGVMFGEQDGLRMACELNNEYRLEEFRRTPLDKLYGMLPRAKYHPCMTTMGTYSVTSEGALFACESFIGDDKDAVGKINEDGSVTYYEAAQKRWQTSLFENPDSFANCMECKLLPACVGGCRYNKFLGKMEGCYTSMDALKQQLINYIEVYIEKENTEDNQDGHCRDCDNCEKCSG